ncbi:MAG: methyltransferase domain-containing protein, partial [Actinomycetota bacterium]|nr:methyltransferase domain-containing protein [Actinomycetota bacterium]
PEESVDRYEDLLAQVVARRPPVPVARAAEPLSPLTDDADATVRAVMRNEADIAYRRRVPRLLKYLQLSPHDRVLDCGSGMGYLSMVMSEVSGATIVAADRDLDRLRWAQREQVAALPVAVDIASLPFADGSFDKVLLSEVLEHLTDDVAGLQELWRLLRPGGVVAICVPHANYPFWWDPINASLELVGAPPMRGGPITGQWTDHERLYLPAQLQRVAERAGFVVTHVDELTHHSLPFHHALVYSIGKPLIEKNLLPARLRVAADRFRGRENQGSRWNPVNLAVGVAHAVDRRNDHPRPGGERSSVSLLARLHKPGADVPAPGKP